MNGGRTGEVFAGGSTGRICRLIQRKMIKAERQEKIIQYLKIHRTISNKEVREILGLADSTTKRILKEMVTDNILIVEGEHKMRTYMLKK